MEKKQVLAGFVCVRLRVLNGGGERRAGRMYLPINGYCSFSELHLTLFTVRQSCLLWNCTILHKDNTLLTVQLLFQDSYVFLPCMRKLKNLDRSCWSAWNWTWWILVL